MHRDPTRSRRRRQPEATALHAVVRENLRTLYAAIEHGFAAPLRAFVRDELETFVDCGVLACGFAVLRCEKSRLPAAAVRAARPSRLRRRAARRRQSRVRRLRARLLPPRAARHFLAGTGQSAAVTVVQHCSSDLRLNPHFHSLALDGVFVPNASGTLQFHRLPSLSNADVAELLHTIVVRL